MKIFKKLIAFTLIALSTAQVKPDTNFTVGIDEKNTQHGMHKTMSKKEREIYYCLCVVDNRKNVSSIHSRCQEIEKKARKGITFATIIIPHKTTK